MQIAFDIETDNITDWLHLSDLKRIKCMAISVDGQEPYIVKPEVGIKMLMEADLVIGHNIQAFDIPALCKVYSNFHIEPHKVRDTLIMARLLHADQREKDFQEQTLPKELIGSHSLKAWGIRLHILKGDAPDFDAAAHDSEQLLEYCKQDVRVTNALYKFLMNNEAMPEAAPALRIEHEFALIIRQQERIGFPFDIDAANALHCELRKEMLDLEQQLQAVFPPIVTERISPKTGKKLKPSVEPFNPGSRQQIASRLMERYKFEWDPTAVTPDGRPRVDESVLASLPYDEAKLLTRYLTITKRVGQLAEGDEAWLKAVTKDGRLHGRVNTNGAITGRCTHRSPNMAQVPAEKEYRRLFIPAEGRVLVGVDASGLELRCLAHFLGKYDDGAYAKAVLEGDIHWTNAIAFGLTKDVQQDKSNPEHKAARNQAKGAIYALIYGAGNDKLGFVLGGDKSRGKKARANFEAKVPAYTKLKSDVEAIMNNRGWLRGLDGRPLYPRSAHAALNTLLQSAGAVVMKQACIRAHKEFVNFIRPVEQVASVHDEYQFMVYPDYAERVGKIVVTAIQEAGKDFNFRCRLDGEYRVGTNWSETH